MLKVNRSSKNKDPYFMLNEEQKDLAQRIVGDLNEIEEDEQEQSKIS